MEEKIKEDLKQAMLNRDETAVSVLRLLISEIRNTQIQKGNPLSDEDIISVVQKEIKKRKESSDSFRKGDRIEAAEKEEAESKVLGGYLPTQMSDEELTKIIKDCINNIGATSMSDMGKVIGMVMGKVGQSADGSRVSSQVREHLSSQ